MTKETPHDKLIKKFAIPKLDFRKPKSGYINELGTLSSFRDEPETERPFEKLMRLDKLAREENHRR